MHSSPFEFPVHLSALEEYQQLATSARLYRFANQPFSEASKLLAEGAFRIKITQKQYYNLVRQKLPDSQDIASVAGFCQALIEEGLKVRYRAQEEYTEDNSSKIVSRRLTNIFFWSPECVEFTRRWASGHCILIDATFNTNEKRLPLLIAVGITNEGETFPIAFAFIKGETADAFDFFFECLYAEIFCDGALPAAVVIADQAAGLFSAANLGSLENVQLQICMWHAAEAVIARLRKSKHYTEAEIQRPHTDNDPTLPSPLRSLVWKWLKSETFKELELHRQDLLNRLYPAEQDYIRDTWQPKEKMTVHCYIRLLANLGCESTQRSEGWHRIVKHLTNGQLSLYESARRIAGKLQEINEI